MLKKGDLIELELNDIANGGDCVGRYQGLAVFVAGGIPGEKVLTKISEKKKNYARGKLIKVIDTVDSRVNPECPVFIECGGCHIQHINYKEQLLHKEKMVKDLLERIGGLENIEVESVIGADYEFAYRNKAQFPLSINEEGKIVSGFYKQGTHQLVAHDDCQIQHPLINRIVNKTIDILNEYEISVYNEKKHRGFLRHLLVRVGVCTNQALLIIVSNGKKFSFGEEISQRIMAEIPELIGVLQNINMKNTNVIMGNETKLLAGQDYYLDYIGPTKYAISSRSFFQVNTIQAAKLYDKVLEYADLSGEETVLDAYCGIGSISLYLARDAKKVIGIEVVEEAIKDANQNARLNGIDNCEFVTARVEDKLADYLSQGNLPDLIVFDPPRKGLDDSVVEAVLNALPDRIIYVSCNPATLARDLAKLKDIYDVKKVQPVDMFPHTYHVETVVLLEKQN
ncbi:23S rRNA (uracil(1939)-C(5))-methyltransferase RlmD [Natronospora cellulosivora (SeqCode)]